MLEIVRNRTWSVAHTVKDGAEGPLTDLTIFSEIRSQIREKVAVRDPATGFFKNEIIVNVDVVISGNDNEILTLSLTRSATKLLQTGDFLIDVVAVRDGEDEPLLVPEACKVVNRPTLFEEDELPDYVAIFNAALTS